jgi:hypothetical protein
MKYDKYNFKLKKNIYSIKEILINLVECMYFITKNLHNKIYTFFILIY